MRKLVLLIGFILVFTACAKDRVKISGRIVNADKSMIYLDEVDVYNTIPTDSVRMKSNGQFSFSFDTKMPCFYQLRISPEKIIILFPRPGEKIHINADSKDLVQSAKISGSHDTEQIAKLNLMLNETKAQLDSISLLYEKAADDSLRNGLNKQYQSILEVHRRASIAYILTNYNSLSSVYALYQQYMPGYYVFYKTTDLQYFRILSDSLSKYHPKSKHVAALKGYTDKQINNYKTQSLIQSMEASVSSLPEIRLPDFTGDTTSLSSLKGKYVLLSFWVSGNQDCVRQNLEMKRIYTQFRNRGFDIFQVSFDNSVEQWQRAVKFDELPWVSVIDEGPNSVAAGNYNVTQLPANYLIGKDNSTIIGKNLTPAQLQDRLQDLFN
jgi:peroxiredoxin